MYRRAILVCLAVVFCLAIVTDAWACHRCRHRRGYGYYGCGYGCGGSHGYRVAKVYRTVRVPVQTCTMSCVATCDPCGNMTYTSVPTYSTTYVNKKVLVHTQVVGRGPVYGNYTDGSYRQVAAGYGYAGGYGVALGSALRQPPTYRMIAPGPAPGAGPRPGYGYGYGLNGAYRMGGYGAALSDDSYVARYKAVEEIEDAKTKSVSIAF
jgi:hypothetical protein